MLGIVRPNCYQNEFTDENWSRNTIREQRNRAGESLRVNRPSTNRANKS